MKANQSTWKTVNGITFAAICIILTLVGGEILYLTGNNLVNHHLSLEIPSTLMLFLVILAVITTGATASAYFFSESTIGPLGGALLTIVPAMSGFAMTYTGDFSALSSVLEKELYWESCITFFLVSLVYVLYLWIIPLKKAGIEVRK